VAGSTSSSWIIHVVEANTLFFEEGVLHERNRAVNAFWDIFTADLTLNLKIEVACLMPRMPLTSFIAAVRK